MLFYKLKLNVKQEKNEAHEWVIQWTCGVFFLLTAEGKVTHLVYPIIYL